MNFILILKWQSTQPPDSPNPQIQTLLSSSKSLFFPLSLMLLCGTEHQQVPAHQPAFKWRLTGGPKCLQIQNKQHINPQSNTLPGTWQGMQHLLKSHLLRKQKVPSNSLSVSIYIHSDNMYLIFILPFFVNHISNKQIWRNLLPLFQRFSIQDSIYEDRKKFQI